MMENHEGPQLFGAGLVVALRGGWAESTPLRVIEHSSVGWLGAPTDSSGTALLIGNNNEVLTAVCEKNSKQS